MRGKVNVHHPDPDHRQESPVPGLLYTRRLVQNRRLENLDPDLRLLKNPDPDLLLLKNPDLDLQLLGNPIQDLL